MKKLPAEKAFVNAGFESFIKAEKICFICNTGSKPIKGIQKKAHDTSKLYNFTFGKSARSVIIMENGFVALSSLSAAAIARRCEQSVPSHHSDDDAVTDHADNESITVQTRITKNGGEHR
jgi:regulator of extracellular matrix RemA (YlzA/DUF370 family)